MSEQFIPFPQEKQAQMETRKKQGHVDNPHHPHNKQRVAAAGIGLAPAGTADPRPAVQPPPRMPVPMAAPIPDPNAPAIVQLTPNAEEEAVSFSLPSNFHYYDFKEIYIKPFKGRHFGKLHRAREEESMLHVAEVVSAVLSTPTIPTGLAFYLTLPDFYACLYWLRLHSFLKHGFTHQTMCRNQAHHDWVTKGGRKEEDGTFTPILPDTLRHAETLTKTSLKTRMLETPPNPDDYVLEYPGLRVVSALMKDVLEVLMNDGLDQFSARIASSIASADGTELTLLQRIAIVDDLSADDVATVLRYEEAAADYGVDEVISWRCKTCGELHKDQIQLEAHSFFPSAA